MHLTLHQLSLPLVLIIEDETEVAQRLAAIIQRRSGAKTLLAASSQAARSAIEAGAKPSVIVLDHNLGPSDLGTTFARWIRARPEQKPKIISYSAQPPDIIVADCAGEPLFDLILTKHTTPLSELVRRLNELLIEAEDNK